MEASVTLLAFLAQEAHQQARQRSKQHIDHRTKGAHPDGVFPRYPSGSSLQSGIQEY